MRMIQLPNYLQEDVSLQADLWLFLGRSSRPPLLLSPPLEIIRGHFFFFWGGASFSINTFFPSWPCKEGPEQGSAGCPL